MKILAINTASSKTQISLLGLDEKSWDSKNDEAEKLMPAIDVMLKKQKLGYDDIDKVVVVKGPGSFTGLRVGVTVANAIGGLSGAQLCAIDTFQLWWARHPKTKLESTALLVFAGKGGVYLSRNQENASKAKLINLPDLSATLKKHKITTIIGDITDDQKEIAISTATATSKASSQKRIFIKPTRTFSQAITELLKAAKPTQLVEPIYIKKPSITKPKKK